MAWAMSSGWPTRPGMCAASAAASPRLPSAGVATRPGSTPLTVMPSPASSSAAARMKPLTRPCSPHSASQGSPCAAGHRGGHQDAPGHAAAQGGKGGLGQPEAAFQVHRQGPFQGAFVQFREGALGKGSGVVQEDVQLAEALQGRAHRSSRGVVLAQVFGRASAQADRLQDGLAAAGGTRRQQNPGAFGGEAFGDGPADALAGAGDQRDAVLQAPHDGRSSSSPRQSRSRRSCSSTSSARVAGQVSAMLWNGVKSTPRLSR